MVPAYPLSGIYTKTRDHVGAIHESPLQESPLQESPLHKSPLHQIIYHPFMEILFTFI